MSTYYDSYYATLLSKRDSAEGIVDAATASPAAAGAVDSVSTSPLPSGQGTLVLAAQLMDVQLLLAKEAVMWRRGPLATPSIVRQLLAAQVGAYSGAYIGK